MCVSPTIIPNPNYGNNSRMAVFKDTVSKFIKVPCGVCSDCLHMKQSDLVQRCMTESISGYPFFATLTYNNDSLPVHVCSDGRKIRYADRLDVVDMVKRIRNDDLFGRPFRYLAVSELGSKRARPHFHVLFFVQKIPGDTVYTPLNLERKLFEVVLSQWSRNYGSKRNPVYKPLCTFIQKYQCGKLKSTYDLHFVQPSSVDGSTMDVSYYVTKYMLKPSDHVRKLQSALKLNLPLEEYYEVWSKVRPRNFKSLNFGFGVYGFQARKMSRQERLSLLSGLDSFKLVRSSIDRSLSSSDYPCFFNPENGRSMPLSRYWKSFGNLYTLDDYTAFYYKSPDRPDNVVIDERSITSKYLSMESLHRQQAQIQSHINNLDLLFD